MNKIQWGNLPPNQKADKRKGSFLSIIMGIMLFISSGVFAQNTRITGNVFQAKDKEPIIGANVVVEGTSIGTVTDMDGNFALEVPANSVLMISYIGCETQKIKTGSNKQFSIGLTDNAIGLEDVVVVGYGSQRKSDLTGGIVALGSDKLRMVSTNNLMDKLSGQVAGLNVSTTNSRPGQEQKLRVRGENSLTADNEPLIVLDGIPYSGSLTDIDPDIIDNISVLKDASSAAIYGSRGANGVILIQTKKGKKGGAVVTYKGQIGIEQAERRIDMMKGPEYITFVQDYNRLKYKYSGDQLDPLVLLNPSERENYKAGSELDWQNIMFRNGLTHSHQLSISGGTDNTTYMASLSHLSQEGAMVKTGLERTNFALNLTQVFNSWLTVGMGTQAVQKETGGVQPYLEAGLKMSPYGIYKKENGDYVDYPMDQTLFYNPMVNTNAINDKTTRNIFISTFADVQLPVKGLSFRTNFGYNFRNTMDGIYYGRNTLVGKTVNGSASVNNSYYYDYTWENILKYNRTFGKHKIDAIALFSMQQTDSRSNKSSGESFVNDESSYHNLMGAEKNKEISSELKETAMLSYMGRINYGFDNRYLLTITGRSDGYSAFGANDKYAFFPSVAAAWVLSGEEFFEGATTWVDILKLRASLGSNGNQAINPYQTLDRLSLTNYIWGDNGVVVNGAYLPSNGVGNPNLKWETSKTFNAGIDFSFWGGRLSGNVEYYVVNTSDLLMSRTVPIMNGYRSIMDNVGATRNQGVEVSLNSINLKQDGFEWSTNVNFSLNRDKIIELRGDGKDDVANRWFIGEPLRVFYDYNVIGTWQEGDDFNAVKQKGAVPGSAKLEDINLDGQITVADKKIIGSKLPSFLLSMGNQLNYKNMYVSFLLNGVFGVTKELHYKNLDRWMPTYNYVSGTGYWTPENPTNEMTSPNYIPYDKHTFYKKMNYVQVKNITVGYNFEKNLLNGIGISALSVNLSVNNLYTFNNVEHALNFDADNMAVSYPTARSYMFGLNLTF